MNEIKRPVNVHNEYHAHVYFEKETREYAGRLCAEAGKLFGLKVGRLHEKLVGPHPKWSCQITFNSAQFDDFIPWLDQHRNNLSVLVHAITDNDIQDHTDFAYWLGDSVELKLALFGV